MSRQPISMTKPVQSKSEWLLVFAAFILMVGMFAYVRHVIVPSQEADAAANDKPRGNLSDLYPRWLGARELLLNGRDPYSAEVTTDIQKGVWGQTLDPDNPNHPKDEMRFAYPLYVVFLLAPTVGMPFETVQRLYFALGIVVLLASVFLWFRAFGDNGSFLYRSAAAMLFLGSYPV